MECDTKNIIKDANYADLEDDFDFLSLLLEREMTKFDEIALFYKWLKAAL